MKCAEIQRQLALSVGGDLSIAESLQATLHLQQCGTCAALYERLQQNQALLWQVRQSPLPAVELAEVRQNVLRAVADPERALGWRIRLERFVLRTLRKPAYAVAAAGIIVIVSLSLFGQMKFSNPQAATGTVQFETAGTLLRPESYREWVFVGSYLAAAHHETLPQQDTFFHNAYINPEAYRAYAKTGRFPQGTVMILETVTAVTAEEQSGATYSTEVVALEASVKDSRFEGGWGYFDFTAAPAMKAEREVRLAARATALPPEAGCLSCHRTHGGKDHVFTQFYPVLAAIQGVL